MIQPCDTAPAQHAAHNRPRDREDFTEEGCKLNIGFIGAGKAGIPGVYEGDHAEEKSGFADAESLSDRWCDLCDRTGDLKLLSVAWHGERYRRKLVLSTVDPAQRSADGL